MTDYSSSAGSSISPLWMVPLVLTVVIVVASATIGYSAYQAYLVILTPDSGLSLRASETVVGATLRFTVNGTIPNKGLYPIIIDGTYSAKAGGILLGSSSIAPINLPPGKVKTFSDTVSVSFLNATNAAFLRKIVLNGTMISITRNFTFTLQPFASLTYSNSSSILFPALLGDMKIGPPIVTSIDGKNVITIPVSFRDLSSYSLPFGAFAEVSLNGAPIGNSSVIQGQANAGQDGHLSFDVRSTQQVGPGTYRVLIHINVGSVEIPIPLELSIS